MASTESPLPLEYAPAGARAPAGGTLFVPTMRSLLLLALTAVTIAWLVRRHTPWQFVAEIGASMRYAQEPFIGPDNRLFVCDARGGVCWYDLATGRVDQTLFPKLSPTDKYLPTGDGREILVYGSSAATVDVYDSRTGLQVARRPNPGMLYAGGVLSADGMRMITRASPRAQMRPTARPSGVIASRPPPPPPTSDAMLWDLSASVPLDQLKPIARIDAPRMLLLARGTRLLVSDGTDWRRLLDAKDFRPILSNDPPGPWRTLRIDPAAEYLPLINTSAGMSSLTIPYVLRSLKDGTVVDSGTVSGGRGDVVWSPDGAVRVVRTWVAGNAGVLSFFDRATGRLLKTASADRVGTPIFFPGSKRYLIDSLGPHSSRIPIYDTVHEQPLAWLDVAAGPRFSDAGIVVSPDGQSILIRRRLTTGDSYDLYRPTGGDCPESRFGLLAFPHAWLLVALMTGGTLSLLGDARRRPRRGVSPVPVPTARYVFWPLAGIALVLTIHFALEACRGLWVRSPAPLVLVAAILLATGSRAARVLMALVLAATVVWCCRSLHLLRLPQSDTYAIFDRAYYLPTRMRLLGMAACTAGALAALVLLLVPRRHASASLG